MTLKRAPVRSTLFNLSFYLVTALACIAMLPTLILPRSSFMWVVHMWVSLVYLCEKYILGLTYEIRGQEHLPTYGSYIVAAKHQSPYETMKLHMLFGDPAIILKKELLKIPLWGWYLKKSDVIAIDRSSPEEARKSMSEGAKHMMEDLRPIVIFPQGTRVPPGTPLSDMPYKSGLVKIQEDTGLPIIPLAMNSGMFWLKGKWNKSPGKVIFEFLPPIEPGLSKDKIMRSLETQIEKTSDALAAEALSAQKTKTSKSGILGFGIAAILFILYSIYWFKIADEVKTSYLRASDQWENVQRVSSEPKISGFPGPITLTVNQEKISSPEGSIIIQNLTARAWPVPDPVISIQSDMLDIKSYKWAAPLIFDDFKSRIQYINSARILEIKYAAVKRGEFEGRIYGTINFKQEPIPLFNNRVEMINHLNLLNELVAIGVLKEKQAVFMGFGLSALEQDGVVRADIVQRGRTLFVGPLPVLEIPTLDQ